MKRDRECFCKGENSEYSGDTILNSLPDSLKSNLPAGRECERQIDQAVYRGLLNRAKNDIRKIQHTILLSQTFTRAKRGYKD